MKLNAPLIPYGLADFARVRADECYYVDKTPFIPRLEQAGYFLGFLRPRRFGKSPLVSSAGPVRRPCMVCCWFITAGN